MTIINKMLLKLEGFNYASLLDLLMGYYNIWLIEDASNLCTIIIPWGKFHYKYVPMGFINSPDNFQQRLTTFCEGLDLYVCI